MGIFIRSLYALLLTHLFMSSATAQDKGLTINDISGHWRIEVINRPESAFKGTAVVPRATHKNAKTIMAETITEDKCCDGRNHARVLQDSRITISEDDKILVESDIVKFLLREEEIEMTYRSDDFYLRWQDPDTLIGTSGGYLPVRWVREKLLIS